MRATAAEVAGCPSCALTTTGQPAARAEAVSPPATEKAKGKLEAPNTATGPIACRIRRMSGRPVAGSAGVSTACTWPPSRSTSANRRSWPLVRPTSPVSRTAPSAVSVSATATSSSRAASSASAAASRARARSAAGIADQTGNARAAARAAASTSVAVDTPTGSPTGSPVRGLIPRSGADVVSVIDRTSGSGEVVRVNSWGREVSCARRQLLASVLSVSSMPSSASSEGEQNAPPR